MIIIFFFLVIIHQIGALTGTCGVGDKIEPAIDCKNIFDCYNNDEANYLADMERKFTKWCDKDGGVCCQANNDDHTCPDGITPRFGEDPCTTIDTNCENTKKYTGTCSNQRCCPSEHDFETNVKCVESKPLAKIYQLAYCRGGLIHYTPEKSEYKDREHCETNDNCREGEFCVNLKTRHCIEDPLIVSSTMYWIMVTILVVVPVLIIIMCVSTFLFCIEMIFFAIVVGIVFFLIGVGGVLTTIYLS